MFENFQKYIEASGHWNSVMLTIVLTSTGIIILLILHSVFKKDKNT